MFKYIFFFIGVTSSTCTLAGPQLLFPDLNRVYRYSITANVSSSTLAPSSGDIRPVPWTLNGTIAVVVYDGYRKARFSLLDWNAGLPSSYSGDSISSREQANLLSQPWEVDYQENGLLSAIYVYQEPVWCTNFKRALSVNFQLVKRKGTYNVQEPCLYAGCVMVYSAADRIISKYSSLTLSSSDVERSWSSIPWTTDFTIERGAPDAISSAERTYKLDDKNGLMNLEMRSSFQYKTHDHILSVQSDLSLHFEGSEPSETIEKLAIMSKPIQYQAPDFSDPTNGIRSTRQEDLKDKTYDLLLKIARKGIDADNIVRNASLTHSSSFIDLLNIMSQLNYTTIRNLFKDLALGTSYDLETSRNIFLEVLPHTRTDACARFIKYLIIEEKKNIEDATLLSIIRKLPFNVANHSQSLLDELEVFTKLGPDFPREIRHAGILSFATLVSKAMEAGKVKQDYFDNLVVKYFRMYGECPRYLDRLIWLQGLCNMGYSAESYTGTIHGDKGRNRHERFWASICSYTGTGRQYTVLESTLPIITNDSEHIQLRIAALHTFLSSDIQANDFLYVHNYLKSCQSDQLKRFWYTTVRSIMKSKSYFDYKVASYYIPFIASQITASDPAHWATNNYIVCSSNAGGTGCMQVLSIGAETGALPAAAMVRLATGGRRPYTAAIYLIAEGVTTNLYKKLNIFTGHELHLDKLPAMIRNEILANRKLAEKVHIDIVVKINEKTVYATHVNQSKFESWNSAELAKSVEDFLRFGSHINQQMAYYPFQMDINIPSELGTPIRLGSTVMSFTSIRGNLTAPSSGDLVWKNDIHIRYQGTSVTWLSTDGPVLQSEHSSRIQQSIVAHIPIKCNITLSPANKAIELRWPNPGSQRGGIAMHSRTQITTKSPTRRVSHTVSGGNGKKGDESSIFFDCERPMSGAELVERLLTSRVNGYELVSSFQPSLIILNSLLLITSPPLGSCGLILPPTQMKETGKDVLSFKVSAKELMMNWNFDMKAHLLMSLAHLKLLTRADEDPTIFGYTADFQLERTGKDMSVAMMFTGKDSEAGKHWAVCIKKQDYITSTPDQDITTLPSQYEGHFIFVFTPLEISNPCSSDEQSTVLSLTYLRTGNGSQKEFVVDVEGRNLPELNDLESSLGHATLGKFLSRFNSDAVNFTSVIKERNGMATVSFNRGMETSIKVDSYSWMLDSWTTVQLLTKLGIYRECRISESSLVTLNGVRSQPNKGELSQGLLLADCSKTPKFAVIKYEDDHLEVVSGGSSVVVDQQGHFNVTNSQSDAIDDFIVTNQSGVIKIHSKASGLRVYKREGEIVILLAHSYSRAACGLCAGVVPPNTYTQKRPYKLSN